MRSCKRRHTTFSRPGTCTLELRTAAAGLPLWVHGIACHLAAFLLIRSIAGAEGSAGLSYFSLLAANWLLAWRLVTVLSGDGRGRTGNGFAGLSGPTAYNFSTVSGLTLNGTTGADRSTVHGNP